MINKKTLMLIGGGIAAYYIWNNYIKDSGGESVETEAQALAELDGEMRNASGEGKQLSKLHDAEDKFCRKCSKYNRCEKWASCKSRGCEVCG